MKLIFAPGFGASKRTFPYYESVFGDNFVRVDFSNCITLDQHFARIEEEINKIPKEEDFVLAGHSFGTAIISHYLARKRPNNLKGVVLIGGGPRFYPPKGLGFLMSLPWIFTVLFLIGLALASPFLFLLKGWKGMMERLEAISLARRLGVRYIHATYNQTFRKVLGLPQTNPVDVPAVFVHLPRDILVPEMAYSEAKTLFSKIEKRQIPTDRYHFTEQFDIYVSGLVAYWIHERLGRKKPELPHDVLFALQNPEATFEALDGIDISRKPVIGALLFIVVWWRFFKPDNPALLVQGAYKFDPSDGVSRQETVLLIAYVIIPLIIILDSFVYPRLPLIMETNPSASRFQKVSIILPTRNEEKNIEKNLKSLFSLNYPEYEIIMVDASTSPQTVELAKQAEEKYNQKRVKFKVLREPPLPDGWFGKAWACWNGYKLAEGDLLLFIDADTIHSEWSLMSSVEALNRNDIDALSVIGKFELVSFWEKVLLPFIHMLMFAVMGGRLMNHKKWPLTLGIGQYLLFKREFYERLGGHKAVRDQISEDLRLARKSKKMGKYMVFSGNNIYSVRMYTSFKEIFFGIGKNVYDGLGRRIMFSIGAGIALFIWLVLPFVVFPTIVSTFGWKSQVTRWFIFGMLALMGLILPALLENDVPFYYAFLFPISVVVFFGILAWSTYIGATNKAFTWKDRIYHMNMT